MNANIRLISIFMKLPNEDVCAICVEEGDISTLYLMFTGTLYYLFNYAVL